jgi:two-component system, chemotaxis family, chemotaxis protein CheY
VSLNVLVADDSAVMRAMIIRILRLTGLSIGRIYEASNGQEAISALDATPVDLALVDINMPIMNGEEMIDRIRKNQATADLPIIVVSTESNIERVDRIRQRKVEFVHKPFTPEVLQRVLVQLTGVRNERFSGENPISQVGPDF